MKIIDVHHPESFKMAVEAIQLHPIVVQLPSVFVLLAAPTSLGATQLNEAKNRLNGKNYGTAIGLLPNFLAQAHPATLPKEFLSAQSFEKMTGTFIRLQFRSKSFQSTTIRNGTHQGLLLNGVFRELFIAMEKSFASHAPDELWGYHNYSAPLCTSCNLSGDPEGSITELEKALDFAQDRRISLFIKGVKSSGDLGSYPIFHYESNQVTIHREGPGLPLYKENIPLHLRAWEKPVLT